MFYENFNDELKSSFITNSQSFASLEGKTQLPNAGLKAESLLNNSQMSKLHEIRNRHLKSEQIQSFLRD